MVCFMLFVSFASSIVACSSVWFVLCVVYDVVLVVSRPVYRVFLSVSCVMSPYVSETSRCVFCVVLCLCYCVVVWVVLC